jgi:uncharacterized protein YndB with AHSA1/START domain
MEKNKFVTDFEINASKKMLFPYISTASGLSQWFADDVTVNEDNLYNFIWDGDDHKAHIATQRVNNFVKFEYEAINGSKEKDLSFVEFRLEMNELTQTVFLHITDYTDNFDNEELQDMWTNLVDVLKEIVGG